jgi:hypothetical protein
MQCFAIFVNLFFCYTAESAVTTCYFNYLISLSFSAGGEL